jgi:hypothetical protein
VKNANKSKKKSPTVEAVSVEAEIASLMQQNEALPVEALEVIPPDDAPVTIVPVTVDSLRDQILNTLQAYSDALQAMKRPDKNVPKFFARATGFASNLCTLVSRGLMTPDDARNVVAGIFRGPHESERLAQYALPKLFGTVRALATDTPAADGISNVHGLYSIILARGQKLTTTGPEGMISKLCALAIVETNTGDTQSSSSAQALHLLGVIDTLTYAHNKISTHALGTSPIAGAFAALYRDASVTLFPKSHRA